MHTAKTNEIPVRHENAKEASPVASLPCPENQPVNVHAKSRPQRRDMSTRGAVVKARTHVMCMSVPTKESRAEKAVRGQERRSRSAGRDAEPRTPEASGYRQSRPRPTQMPQARHPAAAPRGEPSSAHRASRARLAKTDPATLDGKLVNAQRLWERSI